MLAAVKLAMRPAIKTNAYDLELYDLIDAAKADLELMRIRVDEDDPLCRQAIKTYCRLHFGSPEDPERLQAAYDSQKAQLMKSSKYVSWGDDHADA